MRAGASAGAVWVAPAVVGLDRASAAPSSCTDQTISWTSVTGSNPWTATASSGSITIVATITAVTTGIADVYLAGGNVIQRMRSGQSIGDRLTTNLTFTDTAGTICQATSLILDVDQNGRRLGCASNSRFRDEISNLAGAGLTVGTQGDLALVAPGTYASTLECKTNDTENLVMTWTDVAGVGGGGFRWTAGTPPGSNPNLDLQLIKLTPFTVCTTSGAATVSSSRSSSVSAATTPTRGTRD